MEIVIKYVSFSFIMLEVIAALNRFLDNNYETKDTGLVTRLEQIKPNGEKVKLIVTTKHFPEIVVVDEVEIVDGLARIVKGHVHTYDPDVRKPAGSVPVPSVYPHEESYDISLKQVERCEVYMFRKQKKD